MYRSNIWTGCWFVSGTWWWWYCSPQKCYSLPQSTSTRIKGHCRLVASTRYRSSPSSVREDASYCRWVRCWERYCLSERSVAVSNKYLKLVASLYFRQGSNHVQTDICGWEFGKEQFELLLSFAMCTVLQKETAVTYDKVGVAGHMRPVKGLSHGVLHATLARVVGPNAIVENLEEMEAKRCAYNPFLWAVKSENSHWHTLDVGIETVVLYSGKCNCGTVVHVGGLHNDEFG